MAEREEREREEEKLEVELRSCEPRMGIGTREWQKGVRVAWKVGGAPGWLGSDGVWGGGR